MIRTGQTTNNKGKKKKDLLKMESFLVRNNSSYQGLCESYEIKISKKAKDINSKFVFDILSALMCIQ